MINFGEILEIPQNDAQFQVFKEAGGSLAERDYRDTARILNLMAKKPRIEKSLICDKNQKTMLQFDNQAVICQKLGIRTSLSQKTLYCFLRLRKKNDTPEPLRAHGLSDQEIVADILLMTGAVKGYFAYLEHFPVILKRRFPETKWDNSHEFSG